MEDLGDPLGDRVMKNVPMIAREPLKRDQLFKKKSKKSRIKAFAYFLLIFIYPNHIFSFHFRGWIRSS